MMSDLHIITAVVANAPSWVRRELASDDLAARIRAEETLAAMIASALATPITTVNS